MTDIDYEKVVTIVREGHDSQEASLALAVHTIMKLPDIRDSFKAAILPEDGEPLMHYEEIKAIYERADFPISK